MVFSSLTFVCVFLPVTFLLYHVIPSMKCRNILLMIASLIFYAYGEPVYVLLMIVSTICNYIFGRMMETEKKKAVLAAAVIVNLSLLGVFKYTDMLLMTLNRIGGLNLAPAGIKLPIGISFYTFQAMSYVIDVYRGTVKAQRSYWKVLLYIAFFPQLIAGPIVKYHDIERQITERHADAQREAWGFRRFIVGLSKKVLISNVMALAADTVFALELSQVNICSAWLGAAAYMLQIYYDFSGYSDMAVGLGHMFGFTFMENFKYPYVSVTIKEFWRRWHISLSTWFKEYLYIPLGGNRKGTVRTRVNKMIVFFCTGLWHGADWTFVVWGLYHGIFLLLEDVLPFRKLPKWLGHIYALVVVCIGFVLFRADTIGQGMGIIFRMFAGWNFSADCMNAAISICTPLFLFILPVGIIAAVPWKERLAVCMEKTGRRFGAKELAASYLGAGILLILCMLNLSGGTYNPFIYFRF